MSYPHEVLALALVVASLMGMLWAMFWPRRSGKAAQGPTHWDLVYVDDDGVLLFTMVRVLELNLAASRLTAWCSRTGAQRVFKLSKILKATDVQTGERVRLPSSVHLNPEALIDQGGASRGTAGKSGVVKTAAHRRIEARETEAERLARAGRAARQRQHLGWV